MYNQGRSFSPKKMVPEHIPCELFYMAPHCNTSIGATLKGNMHKRMYNKTTGKNWAAME